MLEFLGGRLFRMGTAAAVLFIYGQEPLEHKRIIIQDFMAAVGRDKAGDFSGGNDGGGAAKLFFHPLDHTVQHGGSAIHGAALHTGDGVFSNGVFRRFQTDFGKLGSADGQIIQGTVQPGNDDASGIAALLVDYGDGGGCPHVNDDNGKRVGFHGAHSVDHHIAAKLGRIINLNI